MSLIAACAAAAALAAGALQASDASAAEPPADTRPTTISGDAGFEAYADGVIHAYMTENEIPGLTLAVVRDGTVLLAKGYGLADVSAEAPVTPDATRFEIGSISKTFVWTLVMMLAEQGALDLDADVNTYLDGFEVTGDTPLTLNQIMAHRPGLEDTYAIFIPEIGELPLDEALNASRPAQVMPRGGPTAYSNWATALAAKIIEDITGRAYADLLDNQILMPLGMTRTTFREAEAGETAPPLSASYRLANGAPVPVERVDIGAFAPAGAMASTGVDMAQWMLLHLNEGSLGEARLMSAETYAAMRTRAFDDRPEAADMAHGFMDRVHKGMRIYGHGGAINEFLSNMELAPEHEIGVFLSQNSAVTGAAISRVPTLLIERLVEPGYAPPAPPEDAAARAQEAAGRYLPNRRPFTGMETLFGLNMTVGVAADAEALVISGLGAKNARRFTAIGPDLYENRLGERIHFIRNDAGAVTRMVSPSGTTTLERISGLRDPMLAQAAFGLALLFSATTWLGLWRRLGRNQSVSLTGRLISAYDLLLAAGWFAMLGIMVALTAMLADTTMELFLEYPPALAGPLMVTGSLVAAGGALALLLSAPAFTASGWSIWRKLHHGLFALAASAGGIMLWMWGLAFSAPAGL